MGKKTKLTNKEQMFINEYLRCWNGAEAARLAGYSPKAAKEIAYENLTKPHIQVAIQSRMKEAAMSAEETLARISGHARGDISTFLRVNDDGFLNFDFSDDAAKGQLHLLKKVKTKRSRRVVGKGEDAEIWEDESVEVELYDAQKALDMLARYHNLYTEKDGEGNPLTDDERIARIVAILDGARARRDQRPSG